MNQRQQVKIDKNGGNYNKLVVAAGCIKPGSMAGLAQGIGLHLACAPLSDILRCRNWYSGCEIAPGDAVGGRSGREREAAARTTGGDSVSITGGVMGYNLADKDCHKSRFQKDNIIRIRIFKMQLYNSLKNILNLLYITQFSISSVCSWQVHKSESKSVLKSRLCLTRYLLTKENGPN